MYNLYTKALLTAVEAHGDQKRRWANGQPYVCHPIRVADLLRLSGAERSHIEPDYVLAAALMHDVLEDTEYGEMRMRADFPDDVTDMVLEVTNVAFPTDGPRATRKAINVAHLANTSEWGASIKLADIIDNVRGITEGGAGFAKIYLPEKADALKVLKHGNPRLYALAGQLIEDGRAKLGV